MKIKFLAVLSLALVVLLGACGGKSDADIQSEADKALKANETTATVTAEAKDGVVTIKGEVKDDAAKAKAEELAKVEGAKSVTNEVTVAAPVAPPAAKGDDTEVKSKIEENLKKAGCATATVDVKDGEATLSGKVDAAKMPQCVQAANEGGAKKVKNDLNK
ncbi:MAG: BON domain-containing protein [Pyrinomonadaceae bacterium]